MPRHQFKLNDIHQRSKRGAYRVTTKSETVTMDLNPDKLGSPVARAIAEVIQDGIRSITERASAATVKRAAGRHTGRLFNATGKLVQQLGLSKSGDGWQVGAPPGRLEGETSDLLTRLRELVPELADPRKLLESRKVREAQEQVAADMLTKSRLR